MLQYRDNKVIAWKTDNFHINFDSQTQKYTGTFYDVQFLYSSEEFSINGQARQYGQDNNTVTDDQNYLVNSTGKGTFIIEKIGTEKMCQITNSTMEYHLDDHHSLEIEIGMEQEGEAAFIVKFLLPTSAKAFCIGYRLSADGKVCPEKSSCHFPKSRIVHPLHFAENTEVQNACKSIFGFDKMKFI